MRLFAGTPFDQPQKCERCGALESDCTCPPLPAKYLPPDKQLACLAVEKRRKGKVVTVIRGLRAECNDLPDLLRRLKSLCGAGGTIQNDCLEIQGRHIDRIGTFLSELGFRVAD
jgi:translation initiation factor 1